MPHRTSSSTTPLRFATLTFVLTALFCNAAMSDERHDERRAIHRSPYRAHEFREREFNDRSYLDNRFEHRHYYPFVGFRFGRLPPRFHHIVYGSGHFYFADGIWYSFDGLAYVVISPPIGIAVPMLPPYYTRVWVGATPYYYANRVYYTQAPGGYVVVPEPAGNVSTATPPSSPPPAPATSQGIGGTTTQTAQLFIYPRQGQTADQQARDRTECHGWAVSQVGTDPTIARDDRATDRTPDYNRAMDACLDARGYTVR